MRIKRRLLKLYSKMVHEKASPEYIARGWAIGMFCGCAIPFGFQLFFSIPAAFLLRSSKVGAALGTLLTNQVTIFFIYPIQCLVGDRLIGGDISYANIREAMKNIAREQSFQALAEIGRELIAAFFVGGLLLALICTPLTYFLVLGTVRKYRAGRAHRALLSSLNREEESNHS